MTSTPPSLARRGPAAHTAETPRSSARDAPGATRHAPSCGPPTPALAIAPHARARGTGAWVGQTSRRSRLPSAGGGRSLKTRRQLEKPAKLEMKSRTPLTSWPVGSISSAHRAASSQRPFLRSMARRARVAANASGRDLAAAATSPTRRGPRPRSSRRCGAASPSRGRPAGGGGWRGHTPQSARGPQPLQRGHERVQPRLVRGRGHPVVPGGGPLPEHLAGVGGRPGLALRR
jgi:hypothetical protein